MQFIMLSLCLSKLVSYLGFWSGSGIPISLVTEVVLYQWDKNDAMNPRGVLVAYVAPDEVWTRKGSTGVCGTSGK